MITQSLKLDKGRLKIVQDKNKFISPSEIYLFKSIHNHLQNRCFVAAEMFLSYEIRQFLILLFFQKLILICELLPHLSVL